MQEDEEEWGIIHEVVAQVRPNRDSPKGTLGLQY